MTYSQYQQLKPEDFKRLCGVHHQTFTRMVRVLEEQVEQKKKKLGKPSKLSIEDQVLISLEYWREYRTYFHIGQAWKVHESSISRIVRKVENALHRAGIFQLPGKKQLLDPESAAKIVVIDATETPIQRPKRRQKRFYSGKKKRHTLKTQLVVDPRTKAVICTKFAAGKEHDFHLFMRSQVKLKQETKCLADRGYQRIQKLHVNRVVLQKVIEDGKLLGEGIDYAATPKISAMNFIRSLTASFPTFSTCPFFNIYIIS